ncbi:Cyclin-dependent kinase 20 (CDK-activating kinase p42) (CAK-kinase p42) (CDK-related protein kinase PNQLARE) (Cell cycle-related kinase) (Cell division protein kinase 20) (Cyclin-dependent protein kinase H) (Cyclin-kinase-activating kinase p42), partial [Durusdinium trenchii]
VQALRAVGGHKHVVELLDVFAQGLGVCLALELGETDLAAVLAERGPLAVAEQHRVLRGVLRGLRHVHACGVMHRDVKPSNVVWVGGVVKLADFGLARPVATGQTYTHQVMTRWYRAPEILFGSTNYDIKVDIWGAGLVGAEMAIGRPLFSGENDIEQIFRVIQVLGSPPPDALARLPDGNKISFPEVAKGCLGDMQLSQVVQKMLAWEAAARPTALEALVGLYAED